MGGGEEGERDKEDRGHQLYCVSYFYIVSVVGVWVQFAHQREGDGGMVHDKTFLTGKQNVVFEYSFTVYFSGLFSKL